MKEMGEEDEQEDEEKEITVLGLMRTREGLKLTCPILFPFIISFF